MNGYVMRSLRASVAFFLTPLQDQPWMALSYKVNMTTGTQIAAGNFLFNTEDVFQYIHNQSGPLSTIGGAEATAFEKFPSQNRRSFSNSTLSFLSTFPSDWPEAGYLPLAYAATPANISATDNYLLLGSTLLSTSSRGNMTIRSADTLEPPVISPNWLMDKGDQEQAVAAFQRLRDIAAASGIVESEYQPGANVSTNAEILEWLKENMDLIFHSSSTCRPPSDVLVACFMPSGLARRLIQQCIDFISFPSPLGKMGMANDTTAVVDSHARVRGVSGLRVVDASAFPILPPGYPQSTVCEYIPNATLFLFPFCPLRTLAFTIPRSPLQLHRPVAVEMYRG